MTFLLCIIKTLNSLWKISDEIYDFHKLYSFYLYILKNRIYSSVNQAWDDPPPPFLSESGSQNLLMSLIIVLHVIIIWKVDIILGQVNIVSWHGALESWPVRCDMSTCQKIMSNCQLSFRLFKHMTFTGWHKRSTNSQP